MTEDVNGAPMFESGFRSQLQVAHLGGKDWRLTAPLIYEGRTQFFIVREGFVTDFASIPKPLRWLFDNAGLNSQAGVLHDVLWRASKNGDARVDAWNADALFRRALRQSGATALTRGVMWAAVRVVALAELRFGSPSHIGLVKRVASLLTMGAIGLVTAGPAFLVVALATFIYWFLSWFISIVWRFGYEMRRFPEQERFLPWPAHRSKRASLNQRGSGDRPADGHLEVLALKDGIWLREFPVAPVKPVTTADIERARPAPVTG